MCFKTGKLFRLLLMPLALSVHICLSANYGTGDERPDLPRITKDGLVYHILTSRAPGASLQSLLEPDKERLYTKAVDIVFEARQHAKREELQQLVDALKYNISVISSSSDTTEEWMEIAKLLAYLAKMTHKDMIYHEKEAVNSIIPQLEPLVSDTAFLLKIFPDPALRGDLFWKEETLWYLNVVKDNLVKLVPPNNEVTGFTLLENGCDSTQCLQNVFEKLTQSENSWLSLARMNYVLLKSFNRFVSNSNPFAYEKKSVVDYIRQRKNMSFLMNNENTNSIKNALYFFIKKIEKMEFNFWRFKATQYMTAFIFALEKNYSFIVLREGLSSEQKTILGKNAHLVEYALAVEGFCPLKNSALCFSPPVKPDDPELVSAINAWHLSSDTHSPKLYNSMEMVDLAEKLFSLSGGDKKDLLLSPAVVFNLDFTRKQVDQTLSRVNIIDRFFNY